MPDADAKKFIDELVEALKLRNKIPDIIFFNKWFNNIPVEEFDIIWKNKVLREAIERRIRHPGGLHEWLAVSRTNTFKKWGVSMEKIKDLRTKIEDVIFVNPSGKHGGFGSKKAHDEIFNLIDNSSSFEEFKSKLIPWAEKRLKGGAKNLPNGFFE